ncbi:hypothetical protein J4G48_0015255 [Bradyrhizobium barranii subsp. apii]|uniref:hypothetical protein n=1 Tax=Bradyrhizobium barranii TaxID=2992140 RepID=UPI001AA13E8A|nr:hypothetical protein [Bradyrhizobium barranii]UPT99321.1 hypothetical protein J4G48_0015255 [Bradyrhizobium barranii subsp. apii]
MQNAPFTSRFAILGVRTGRAALAKRIAAGEAVRVRVDLVLDQRQSPDDGTSIEFSGCVESVKQFKAPARARKGRRSSRRGVSA